MKRLAYIVSVFATLAATGALAAARPAPAPESDMSATPKGVTVKVIRIGYGVNPAGSNSNQPRDRIVFADKDGMVLYSSAHDPAGKSTCNDKCAEEWVPFLAADTDVPVGLWTVVARDDGKQQWAFRGKPMYTYVKDKKPAVRLPYQVTEEDAALAKATAAKAAAPAPPQTSDQKKKAADDAAAAAAALGRQGGEGKGQDVDGRQVLEILPEEWSPMPVGITVEEVRTAPGQVITDDEGIPLYVYNGKLTDGMSAEWKPVPAPHLALPIGDFTVITRPDGESQWAYKGKPLFRFAGDLDFGDSNGRYADQRFQLVYMVKYFMPSNVVVKKDHIYGGLLATAEGKVLYARENQNGGVDAALRSDRGRLGIGEKIGVTACDKACEETWNPLIAPNDAVASGYWSVYDRPDGRKQWAYYGYAMYTYNGKQQQMASVEVYDDVNHLEATKDGTPRQTVPYHWRVAPP